MARAEVADPDERTGREDAPGAGAAPATPGGSDGGTRSGSLVAFLRDVDPGPSDDAGPPDRDAAVDPSEGDADDERPEAGAATTDAAAGSHGGANEQATRSTVATTSFRAEPASWSIGWIVALCVLAAMLLAVPVHRRHPLFVPTGTPAVPLMPAEPAGGLASTIAGITSHASVDVAVLNRTAADLRTQRLATSATEMEAASQIRSESRLALVSFSLLPVAAAVVLLGFIGAPTAALSGGAGWLLIAAAVVLTVAGMVWLAALGSGRRLIAGRARRMDARRTWIVEVVHTLETAALHATAGARGMAALRAAAPRDADDPVRQVLEDGPAADRPPRGLEECSLGVLVDALERAGDPGETERLLRRSSEHLHERYRADVDRWARLSNLRTLGPLMLCFLPATALVLAVFLLEIR